MAKKDQVEIGPRGFIKSFHGIDSNSNYDVPDELLNEIFNIWRYKEIYRIVEQENEKQHDYSKEQIIDEIKEARHYLNSQFKLNYINKINPETLDEFFKELKYLDENKYLNNNTLNLLYEKYFKVINPLNLTINIASKSLDDYSSCDVYNIGLIRDCPEDKKTGFNNIKIAQTDFYITGSTYCHEICHTQLETKKNSYHKSCYCEFLPEFLGLIYYYDTNNFEKLNYVLLQEFNNIICIIRGLNYLNNLEYYKDVLYSEIIAINLFVKYENSSYEEQKQIKQDIQNVFDGLISSEELAIKYFVDIKNTALDNMERRLKKKI